MSSQRVNSSFAGSLLVPRSGELNYLNSLNQDQQILSALHEEALKDYFGKRDDLIDLPPIEPLPPLENSLDITQKHQDWVRSLDEIQQQRAEYEELEKCVQVDEIPNHSRDTWNTLDHETIGLDRKIQLEMHRIRMADLNEMKKDSLKRGDIQDFTQESELLQLFELERTLAKLIQSSGLHSEPSAAQPDLQSDYADFEPVSQSKHESNIRILQQFFIRGDLRKCVICNADYQNPTSTNQGNLPRVLYCGDCLCEGCIVKQIQKASITDKQQNVAACQVTCPICCVKHVFKLSKSGFLICNDKYIKVRDERGPVNFFPGSKLNPNTASQQLFGGTIQLMDQSISIPDSLVLRSLPINTELLEMIKNEPSQPDYFKTAGKEQISRIMHSSQRS